MNSSDLPADPDQDIIGMLAAIWDGRWWVAATSAASVVLALMVVLMVTPQYEAEVIAAHNTNGGAQDGLGRTLGGVQRLAALSGISLGSGQGNEEVALATLRSRSFAAQFMEAFNIRQQLFPDSWDPAAEKWLVAKEDIPSAWQAYKKWNQNILVVSEDSGTGLVHLKVRWHDPVVAASWANGMIVSANEVLQQKALARSQSNLTYLTEQMATTRIEEIREAIANLIQQETATMMIASGTQDFAFKVIDPAVVAEEAYFPRPVLLTASALLLGLILGILAALIRAYIKGRELLTSPPK